MGRLIKQKNKIARKTIKPEKPKIWKIISIIFIVIFSLILIVGLIRLYHFNSFFHKPSKEDINSINSVKSVVYNYMLNEGKNISLDNIKPFDRIREFDVNNTKKKLIGVSVMEGNNENFFLVDVDSKEIMMHSQTEFYGWLNNSKNLFLRPPPPFSKEPRHR